jgi:6-phosphogluconolactonase
LDADAGTLVPCGITENVRNPSYIAFDPKRRFLYCVNEFKEFEGAASGAVSAFRIDQNTGELTFLNMKASRGTDPCHLMVDATGNNVLIANFASGSVCVLRIESDGSLGRATEFIQHAGSSVDPRRQAGPHAHAVEIDRANRYVFVPDLGLDKVMIYRFDAEAGRLAPNPHQPWISVKPGAGPRQLVFHPTGQFAFLINELNSTMTAYRYDAESGSLAELNTLSTLPEGFSGQSTCAEVQIAPSGKFLYGSNRGHDSIAIFAIDEQGQIRVVGHESTRGKIPRNFEISPSGEFLAAANQDTDNVVMFQVDRNTGHLTATGNEVEVGTPVCVRFMT